MTPERAGELCDGLDKRLRGSEMNLAGLADLIVTVIREEAWRERRVRTGEIVTCASFLELLTSPPLKGYGEDPRRVESLLKDDPEALTMFRKATTSPRGRPAKDSQQNSDNITIFSERGTARAYVLDRLQREAPHLFERVVAGGLSAHAAALKAGFRQKTIAVQPTVQGFARAAAKHLDRESIMQLSELLTAAK